MPIGSFQFRTQFAPGSGAEAGARLNEHTESDVSFCTTSGTSPLNSEGIRRLDPRQPPTARATAPRPQDKRCNGRIGMILVLIAYTCNKCNPARWRIL